GRVADREVRLPGPESAGHADRPAVLDLPGHRRPRVRPAVRRARLARAVAPGAEHLDRVRIPRHRARDTACILPLRRPRADPGQADAGPRAGGGRREPRRPGPDDFRPRTAAARSLGPPLWHHLVQCAGHGRVRRRSGRLRPYPRLDDHDAAACRDPLQRVRPDRRVRGRFPPDAAGACDDGRKVRDRAVRNAPPPPGRAAPRPRTVRLKLHSPGLAGRLAIVTAVLVTLAVAAVSLSGVRSLRKLAEAEGFARVELAVTAAREALRTSTENLLTAARVLAERPTLERLLSEPESDDALMP